MNMAVIRLVYVSLCVFFFPLLAEKEKQEVQRPQAKEARKEKKVLEKKVALSRKRKRDSRCVHVCSCSCSCVHLFNFLFKVSFFYLECRKEDDSGSKKKSDGDPESVKKDVSLLSLPLSHSLSLCLSFFNSITFIPPPFSATPPLFLICSCL